MSVHGYHDCPCRDCFEIAIGGKSGWVSGSGMAGCLYDSGPDWSETKRDAIESLIWMFDDLSARYQARIRRDLEAKGIHYFDRRIRPFAGADYCEVSEGESDELPALCHDCEEAGCDDSGGSECCSPHAYGGDDAIETET